MQTSFFSDSMRAIKEKGILNILPVLAVKGQYQLLKPDQNDGFLFDLKPWIPVEFFILIDIPAEKEKQIKVATVFSREKKIVEKRNIAKEKHYLRFVKRVKNRATENLPYLSTKHEGNNVRIVFTANGWFEMWEAAIVTRILKGQANFFLTVQKLYQARMYNFEGQVYLPETQYPGYQHWPNLQKYLNTVVDLQTLEKIDFDRMLEILDREDQSKEIPTEENRGVVEYFCLASGLGLARTATESAFIHWTKIMSDDRMAFLKDGQRIRFDKFFSGAKEEEPALFLEGMERELTPSPWATKSCPGNHSKQLFDQDEVEKLTVKGVRQ